MVNIPAFGEETCIKNAENCNAEVYVIENANKSSFDLYCELFIKDGYIKKEVFSRNNHLYSAFQKDNEGVFINYYDTINELYIVTETNCNYFAYSDKILSTKTTPQITNIHLEDYGMSYVVRLSDGRFIIFDGGNDFAPHRDNLYNLLRKSSPHEKAIIAAWILTHPHDDHYHCFSGFYDEHKDDIIIEKVILNFPDANDLEHYPGLSHIDKRIEGYLPDTETIPKMYERITDSGAELYMAHTGQTYHIGDAKCEVLACIDDTMHTSNNINGISVAIRMELAGQVILWAADTSFDFAKIPQKHGEYLKSDILQIPHHGFGCGDYKPLIEGYNLIDPEVCLLPVSDYNAYVAFCTFKEGANHLMTKLNVKEIITGEEERTISLPYYAPEYTQNELKNKYLNGRDSCGANTWIFSDLHTSKPEDFEFTILNMTKNTADISIDLFFESAGSNIRYIKADVKSGTVRKINITSDDVDGDAIFFNWMSLKEKDIPENSIFAARFMSSEPIVVTHATHTPSHKSTNR